MAEQLMSSGDAYAFDLLNKWQEIGKLSEQVREGRIMRTVLKRRYSSEEMRLKSEYIAKLTRLWLELLPMVEGRSDFSSISEEFMRFESYYKNPLLLQQKTNMEELFELEKVERQVFEKLKITKFEKSE